MRGLDRLRYGALDVGNRKRAEAILNSPLGCTFIAAVQESAMEPDALSAAELSLRLAAASVDLISQWRSDHDTVVARVLEYGKELSALTRAVLEHAGTSWWFDPIDLNRQLWVSPEGVPPDTAAWHPPRDPSSRGEVYAQKPTGFQNTSTLFGEFCSLLMACDERAGDYWREYPLVCWKLQVAPDVKVYEVHDAGAWHQLCLWYPARRGDGGLTVNWGAAANDWDGVHLSFWGLLSCEQARCESAEGWSLLDFWHAEQTYWLRSLETVSDQLPNHEWTQRSGNEFRHPRAPFDTDARNILTTDPVGPADVERLKRSIVPLDNS